MPVEKYGIYLAYAPTVKLQHQGLGRYLAAFLKAASRRTDIRFVLACPSWSKDDLLELCLLEGVPSDSFDIIAPDNQPVLLRLYAWYQKYKRRDRKFGASVRSTLNALHEQHVATIERTLATSRNLFPVILLSLYLFMLALLSLPIFLVTVALSTWIRLLRNRFSGAGTRLIEKVRTATSSPQEDSTVIRMYGLMEEQETKLLVAMVNGLTEVRAWYCPTAFWPSFNEITAPRVMCVPDVVLREFPIRFSKIGGERYLQNFKRIESAIRGGHRFITYSSHVKYTMLVEQFQIPSSRIDVVHHATNDLGSWVQMQGFADNGVTGRRYAEALFSSALLKATNLSYAATFANYSAKFIFYPSQFRPSKNIINLLKAYQYLLRERNLEHKLVLTGNPQDMPEVKDFLSNLNLENDVLCLRGLTVPELAACYRLAELAINPSLSEGGCPFPYGEALSVGTPVIMARIPVTEEVISDVELQELMLFDPYVWRDMADRMIWAIQNREFLRSAQLNAYKHDSKRTWDDVVSDHIDILNGKSKVGSGS